jgi:hypothetical protein
MRKGGFEFGRRRPLPGIDFEIKRSTFVRMPSHGFAPSWFQNWFQPSCISEPSCRNKVPLCGDATSVVAECASATQKGAWRNVSQIPEGHARPALSGWF